MAWLRGGDTTPDPEMENSFLDIMTVAVAERLIANRQEYERMARAAQRAERRANRPAGCLSIKAMLEEVRRETPSRLETVLAEDEDLPEVEPVRNRTWFPRFGSEITVPIPWMSRRLIELCPKELHF